MLVLMLLLSDLLVPLLICHLEMTLHVLLVSVTVLSKKVSHTQLLQEN